VTQPPGHLDSHEGYEFWFTPVRSPLSLRYKTQTLVCAGDGEYIHVKVHRDFVRKFHLMGYQSRKAQDTPITYF
uniref:Uncharacterized protein n=1 Tax=Leptobrachium leishanense TaxID=445787 RepID=A0A8C5MAH9_9ANUR